MCGRRANAANDRGAVADDLPMDHLLLQLQRPPEQKAALEKLIEEMHTPGSPHFHQWLTAAQFTSRYGLSQEDVAKISGWLVARAFM